MGLITPLPLLPFVENCRHFVVKYYKQTKKGVETMSSVFDEVRVEEKEDIAIKMIKDSMPYEKVAEYSGLPIEKIRELAERKPA